MLKSGIFAGLVAIGLSIAAWANGSNKKVVNIYTTRHYEADLKLAQDFEKQTGISVNIVQIKEPAQLIARVTEEKEKTQADLIITTDVGNLWRASEAGLFQPLASEAIRKAVAKEFRRLGEIKPIPHRILPKNPPPVSLHNPTFASAVV